MKALNRRKFLQSALAAIGYTGVSAILPRQVFALTQGASQSNWAIASDPSLLTRVWQARFSNTLPWALDPTNTVLAKALNLPASGVQLNPALPNGVGFVYHPDPGSADTYSIKAAEIDWPMLAPLGNAQGIPTTRTWGYGNGELAHAFADGSGLPVTFPGRTFVVRRNEKINVNWRNELVDENSVPLPHLVGVDQTITMQNDQRQATVDPLTKQVTYAGNEIMGVPIAMHHHGGDSRAEFDGGPDQWTTPRRQQIGPGIAPGVNANADALAYTYLNSQEAALHWYHDHGEGVTRINAYAGLAGLYVIRDANEDLLVSQGKIPSGPYEVPIVLQDKCFTATGEMAYAGDPADYPVPDLNLPAPTHHPEQFGDIMIVNGMAWPNLDVEPREYRLRLLNGSDSRVYVLKFGFGGTNRRGGFNEYLPIMKIATDLGFLDAPVEMLGKQVTIAPGERMDVVVDFASVTSAGGIRSVTLVNSGNFPFPGGTPTTPNTMGPGTVMRFNVNMALNAATSALGMPALPTSKVTKLKNNLVLRGLNASTPRIGGAARIPAGTPTRRILLAEGADEYGRIMPLLGSFQMPSDAPYLNYPGESNLGTMGFSQLPTETPRLGTTEVWEFWNNTVDAHPIHMHLVRFRIVNREPFGPTPSAPIDPATGQPMVSEVKPMINGWLGERLLPNLVQLSGLPVRAPADEQGWKDTVLCYPGEVTRVLVTFDRPGKYVYHCHILSHEEHDMMRWYQVV